MTTAARASDVRRARHLIQAAGLIFYMLSVQGLFAAGVGAYVFLNGGDASDLLLPASGAALAVSYAVVGYYLRRLRVLARNFAFVYAAFGVFFFPIGTVLGSLIVLAIDRANRAGLFPARPAAPQAAEPGESTPLLRFEPDLSTESAG